MTLFHCHTLPTYQKYPWGTKNLHFTSNWVHFNPNLIFPWWKWLFQSCHSKSQISEKNSGIGQYWSSQPIIPTLHSAASVFLHCFDDNVLRQSAKVMTISQCGAVRGYAALCSNVLALHSATFNIDTWSEIDTRVWSHEPCAAKNTDVPICWIRWVQL